MLEASATAACQVVQIRRSGRVFALCERLCGFKFVEVVKMHLTAYASVSPGRCGQEGFGCGVKSFQFPRFYPHIRPRWYWWVGPSHASTWVGGVTINQRNNLHKRTCDLCQPYHHQGRLLDKTTDVFAIDQCNNSLYCIPIGKPRQRLANALLNYNSSRSK